VESVSVIIPTYNRSFCLERAVRSVLRQSYSCDELIIVDDGSTDDTKELVADIKKQFTQKIFYYFQPNRGVAAARNYGIYKASSSLLAFLDSDDHWLETKLAQQVESMIEHPNFLISHTKEKWLRQGKHLNQKKIHIPRGGDIFDHCLMLCGVGMSTVLARKELFEMIGYFNEDFFCCEDYEFWLRVTACHPFLLIDKPLTIKEGGRSDQLSYQHRIGMDKLRIHAIENILQSGELSVVKYKLALNELKKKCLIYGQGCLKHEKIEEGRYYLELAKQYNPSF